MGVYPVRSQKGGVFNLLGVTLLSLIQDMAVEAKIGHLRSCFKSGRSINLSTDLHRFHRLFVEILFYLSPSVRFAVCGLLRAFKTIS